jgi:hypothetical protein
MTKIHDNIHGQNPGQKWGPKSGRSGGPSKRERDRERRRKEAEETGNPHYGTKLSNSRPMKFGGCAGLLRLRFHFQALVAPEENSIRILFDL